MKTRIAAGAIVLLAVSTALAGTFVYESAAPQPATTDVPSLPEAAEIVTRSITPETVAFWKATAMSNEYVALKAPI
jgi:hypothetical protein